MYTYCTVHHTASDRYNAQDGINARRHGCVNHFTLWEIRTERRSNDRIQIPMWRERLSRGTPGRCIYPPPDHSSFRTHLSRLRHFDSESDTGYTRLFDRLWKIRIYIIDKTDTRNGKQRSRMGTRMGTRREKGKGSDDGVVSNIQHQHRLSFVIIYPATHQHTKV